MRSTRNAPTNPAKNIVSALSSINMASFAFEMTGSLEWS
jgi:hypothetical protein